MHRRLRAVPAYSPPNKEMNMRFNRTVIVSQSVLADRTRNARRILALVVSGGLAITVGLTVPRGATAQEDGHERRCRNGTLRGDYGFIASGVRAIGPTATEQFVAVGMRTYDGRGNFTDVASFHGQVIPPVRSGQVTGTYHVNADCTGTSIFLLPAPFPPIESDFVIVNDGQMVTEAVMSPQPNIVSTVFRRK
jgi:hypothetical protein